MHLTKWKIKKDFFYLFIYVFFFFCTQHTPDGISCGWGKKLQVSSWVRTGWMVSVNNGLMSCFDNTRRPQSWLDRFETEESELLYRCFQNNPPQGSTLFFFFFYAYKTFYFLGYKLNSSQLPTNGPLPAWWMHTMLTLKKLIRMMICINYIKGFQTEMHVCKVLWINSLLELLTI